MAGVLIIGINSCELDNTNKEHIFDFNILHTNALIGTPLDIAVKGIHCWSISILAINSLCGCR